jgi:hypothetical protein
MEIAKVSEATDGVVDEDSLQVSFMCLPELRPLASAHLSSYVMLSNP